MTFDLMWAEPRDPRPASRDVRLKVTIKRHDVDQVRQQQIKDGGASPASLDPGFLFMVTFSSPV